MGHQSYVLLCTETTVSNPPVVFPKSSCDVHLFRGPCIDLGNCHFQKSLQIQMIGPKNTSHNTIVGRKCVKNIKAFMESDTGKCLTGNKSFYVTII